MDNKQKATIGAVVVMVGVIGYMAMGMFGGDSSASDPSTQAAAPMPTPTVAPVAKEDPTSQVAPEELQRQQQIQAQYIATLNQTQMAKAQQDLYEVNQKIADAQAKTIESQVKIVGLLTAPEEAGAPPTSAAQPVSGQGQPAPGQETTSAQASVSSKDVKYGVVSISKLQNKWGAVVSYAANLYSVHAGDVLPPDNSTVVSIDNRGVVLEKDGMRTKISMVSGI